MPLEPGNFTAKTAKIAEPDAIGLSFILLGKKASRP
jgi:hypothetical protein